MPNVIDILIVVVIIALGTSYFVSGEKLASVVASLKGRFTREDGPLQDAQGREYALRRVEELREWSRASGECDALKFVNAAGRALYEDEEETSDGSS